LIECTVHVCRWASANLRIVRTADAKSLMSLSPFQGKDLLPSLDEINRPTVLEVLAEAPRSLTE
jgi:hypothetical protein